jgi:hypothetical protein
MLVTTNNATQASRHSSVCREVTQFYAFLDNLAIKVDILLSREAISIVSSYYRIPFPVTVSVYTCNVAIT